MATITEQLGLITGQPPGLADLTGDGHGHHIPGTPLVYRHGWKEIEGGPQPPSFFGAEDSKSRHTRPDGTYTAERLALHRRIIAGALAGHPPEAHPQAIFLGGGPASGKSSVQGRLHNPGITVNADDIMGKLPEYRQMIRVRDPMASTFSHREAADIADKMQDAAFGKRVSFTLDGTGDRDEATMAARAAKARKAGYQAVGEYVTADTDEAVRRAALRAQETGRMVPESAIRAIHASVSRIFSKLAAGDVFDKAELWDNNTPMPTLVGSKEPGGHWTVHDQQQWQKFLAKGGETPGPG